MYNDAVIQNYCESIFEIPRVISIEILSLINSEEVMQKICEDMKQFDELKKVNLNISVACWPTLKSFLDASKTVKQV